MIGKAICQLKPPISALTRSLNQPIKPNSLSELAIITKTENQTIVSQAPFSDLTSSQVNTEVNNKTTKPIKAVVVASIENKSPVIQRNNKMKKVNNINHSFLEIGPISLSF
ncbi:hypothetical protein D3C87_1656360 [compost metagenome]